jgi:hypothetical protein
MPSEYDFLSPYSRRLRRAGLATIGLGAFLAGAVAMAAIVALPLVPLGGRDTIPARETNVGAAQEPAEAVTPPATKLGTSATAPDTSAKSAPANSTPDTAMRRETTGLTGTSTAASGGNPPDAKPAAPPASSYKDTSAAAPPVPAAQTVQSDPSGGASAGEANVAPTNAGTSSQVADSTGTATRAATGGEASPRAKKKSTASRTRRAQAERVARARALSERRAGREYVDGNGVRYFVMPRSAESAFAYDDAPRTRRLFITRPGGPFYDD